MKDVGFYLHTIHHQGPTARQASPPSLPPGPAARRARRAAAPRGIIGHCRRPCRWVTVVQMEGLGRKVSSRFGDFSESAYLAGGNSNILLLLFSTLFWGNDAI